MWIRLRRNWKMRDAQSILWSTNFLEGLFKFTAGGRLHRDFKLFNVFLTKLAFKMQRMFTGGQVNHPPTWSVLFGATVFQSKFRLDPVKWCLLILKKKSLKVELNRPGASVWSRSVNQICLLFPLSRSGIFWNPTVTDGRCLGPRWSCWTYTTLLKNDIPVRIIEKSPLPRIGQRGAGLMVSISARALHDRTPTG